MSEKSYIEEVLIYPKFKIGDMVVTKATGMPRIGAVMSIIHPILMPEIRISILNKQFENVENKMFYFVVFEEASRQISYKEAVDAFPEITLEEYEESFPESSIASFCEDDLELW